MGLLRGSLWALADHALISFVNFATALLVARATTPSEFGAFALAYGAILLADDVQSALVTQAHNVLSHTTGGRYASYTLTTGVQQIALAAALCAIPIGLSLGPFAGTTGTATLLLWLGLAILTGQPQEYARRVLYSERRTRGALANDLIAYGAQLVLVVVLDAGGTLSASGAFASMAIAALVAVIVGAVQLRESLRGRIDLAYVAENWRFGRWLLAGALTSWFSIQAYAYIVAASLGLAAAGVLKAADILLRPINLGIVLMDSVLLVEFGRAAAEPIPDLRRRVALTYRWTVGPAVAYCLLVGIAATPLLKLVFRGTYDGTEPVVWLLALFYVLRYAGQVLSIALRARRMNRPMFDGALYATLFTLVLGWTFIVSWGVLGAAAAMVVSMAINDATRLRWYLSRS